MKYTLLLMVLLAYLTTPCTPRSPAGLEIEVLETMEERETITRYMIRYPSDGLNIYGFMNVPKGGGPFPIIFLLHGYGASNLPTRLGLWGQSLGDRVALRVATISADIKAIVLYSSISGDERKNIGLFYGLTEEQVYLTEMETQSDVMMYISH